MEKMEKTKREEYIDELSEKLKEWDKELEKLEANIEEDVDELNNLRSKMQKKLDELRETGEQALKPLKEDFNKMLKDSKKGIRSIREELFER